MIKKSLNRNNKQDTDNGNNKTKIRYTGFNNDKRNTDSDLNNSQGSLDTEFNCSWRLDLEGRETVQDETNDK